MAGPYLSWPCSMANCQLHLSVLYGTMQVHYVQEQPRVKPGLFPRWPWYFNNVVVVVDLCNHLLPLLLLPSLWRHCDLLHLALSLVHYQIWTPHLWPLALLLEPGALHAHTLLGLLWVPFTLSFVLRTTDTPARKLIKIAKNNNK